MRIHGGMREWGKRDDVMNGSIIEQIISDNTDQRYNNTWTDVLVLRSFSIQPLIVFREYRRMSYIQVEPTIS